MEITFDGNKRITAHLNGHEIHTDQPLVGGGEKQLSGKIKLEIQLPADFPKKYRPALISTAEVCAVKRSIADPPVFEVITSIV